MKRGPPFFTPYNTSFFWVPLCAIEGCFCSQRPILLTWLRKRLELESQGCNVISWSLYLWEISELQAEYGTQSDIALRGKVPSVPTRALWAPTWRTRAEGGTMTPTSRIQLGKDPEHTSGTSPWSYFFSRCPFWKMGLCGVVREITPKMWCKKH